MSVVAGDLVEFHAATQSDTDVGAVGGAIDALRRPDFTQLASNAALEVVSSAAGDTTQTVTVEARKADGTVVSQTVTLNGTTAVQFGTIGTVERVLKAEMSATATGTVTVRVTAAGATVRVIPVGERGFSAVHRKGSSSTSATVDYYAKTFWKNTNGTFALLGAAVSETADPTGLVTFALANTVGDSGTAADRKSVPGAVTAFDNAAKNVPGTDLAAGAAIGVWRKLSLAVNNAAIRSTHTLQLAGSTT